MRCRKTLDFLSGAILALPALLVLLVLPAEARGVEPWIPPSEAPIAPIAPIGTIATPAEPLPLDVESDRVNWQLKPRSVLSETGAQARLRLRCGHYGVFDLSVEQEELTPVPGASLAPAKTATLSCLGFACGEENPPLYPTPPATPSGPTAIDTSEGTLLTANSTQPDLPASWVPCAGGSCYASVGLTGYTPARPWVAVLDWNNLHGWSIGWTILGIAGADRHDAVLLPLDEERLIPFSRTGSTDVHVLVQLCSIVERVEIGGIAPPAVINMSFGRRLREEDAVGAAACDATTLSCQIARVLERLAGSPAQAGGEADTIAVASSGNDRRPLFPAGLENVLPAGSLQLGLFEQTGQAESSWETPTYAPRAEATMPGYGLCLGESLGTASANEWAAPAGTSYAAAVFSGWLADTLGRTPVFGPFDGRRWYPSRACNPSRTVCTHRLAHGTTLYGANPRIDALLAQMFQPLRPCGSPSPVQPGQVLKLTAAPASEAQLPADTFLDVFADFKLPAPPSSPCVPCRGLTSINGGSSAAGGAKVSLSGFSVDLSGLSSGATPFPPALAVQTEIEALYLRIGTLAFLRLTPSTAPQSGFAALEAGGIRRISLAGVPDFLRSAAQPSLVFVLRPVEEELAGRPFWVSIPILIGK